jgi:hypothetical protein
MGNVCTILDILAADHLINRSGLHSGNVRIKNALIPNGNFCRKREA